MTKNSLKNIKNLSFSSSYKKGQNSKGLHLRAVDLRVALSFHETFL